MSDRKDSERGNREGRQPSKRRLVHSNDSEESSDLPFKKEGGVYKCNN